MLIDRAVFRDDHEILHTHGSWVLGRVDCENSLKVDRSEKRLCRAGLTIRDLE